MSKIPSKQVPDLNYDNSLLSASDWSGSGTVIILQTGATLHFTMRKKITATKKGVFHFSQKIDLLEINEVWSTDLTLYEIKEEHFLVEIENPTIGKLQGDGTFSEKDIGWKVSGNNGKIRGKTQLTLIEEGSYLINSAYNIHNTSQISISGILTKNNSAQ